MVLLPAHSGVAAVVVVVCWGARVAHTSSGRAKSRVFIERENKELSRLESLFLGTIFQNCTDTFFPAFCWQECKAWVEKGQMGDKMLHIANGQIFTLCRLGKRKNALVCLDEFGEVTSHRCLNAETRNICQYYY